MKFRILCFSLLCMIAISFTACSNNASDNDNVNNKPDSIAVPPISPTSIAGLRCADPYGEGLASNSQGAYFTVLRPDGNLNIMYLDYSTGTEVYLCSQANCTHDSEGCTSWIPSKSGLIPSLICTNDFLCVIGCGINDPTASEGEYPYLEVMDLDGKNRKVVYRSSTPCEWQALINDDENFYTIEVSTCIIDGQIEKSSRLVRINLKSGIKEVLTDLSAEIEDASSVYVCDAIDNSIYFKSFVQQGDSYNDIITNYYEINILDSSITLLCSNSTPADTSYLLKNRKMYSANISTNQISEADIGTGDTKIITRDYAVNHAYSNPYIKSLIDNHLIVNSITDSGTDTAADCIDVIDCSNGNVFQWPIYYEDSQVEKKFPVNIAAEIEDKYVIKVAETVIAVTYNNENYAMSNPVYALISKDDFWNGNNNYQAFSIVN